MSRIVGTLIIGVVLVSCAESKEAPLPECTKGEVRCDPTGTKEMVCEEGADGKFTFQSKACPPGTQCDPATGRCPDLCGECNTPLNECYQREGTCWQGECSYEPADGAACDDNDPCTLNDVCRGGFCRPGAVKECTFVPADECVSETQLKAYATEGKCENGDCVYPSALIDCPLGCENGKCKGDPCQGVTCDEAPSECHKTPGICNNGTCTYLPDDGKTCDDNDACTDDDVCLGGKCKGTAKVCDSPPDDSCKDENTLISYAAQGTCKAGDCSYEQTEVTCDRGCDSAEAACKSDPCEGITCTTPPNTCYKDEGTCNDEGKCEYEPDNGKDCDDEDACTTDDACSDGVCKGSPVVCNTPPKNTCKDENTLTVYTAPGVCDSQGECAYAKADIPCANGCDSGSCIGDPCALVTCDDPPNDQCYSVPGICSGGNCTYLPKSGVACDDADSCTKDDVCVSGDCEGTPYTCQDSLVCTENQCDGEGGCSYPVMADACLLKLSGVRTCIEEDAANPDNACQLCLPGTSQSFWGVSTGTEIDVWDFDDGTLQSWTVTINPDNASTAVKWQLDDERPASGSHSVYFGDVATRTYDDGYEEVRGTLTSPSITLPAAADAGKLCLEFKMFKHTEKNTVYDALQIFIIDGTTTTEVYHAGKDANYGNTDGAFVTFSADISAAAGSQVQIELSFDSGDGYINDYEGVYIDDIRVLKQCSP